MSSEKPDQIQASVAAALSRLRGDLGPSSATAPKIEEPPVGDRQLGDRAATERGRPANDVRGDPFFRSIQSSPPATGMAGSGRAPIPMTPFPRMQAPQEAAPSEPPPADEAASAPESSTIEIPAMPKRAPAPDLVAMPESTAMSSEPSQPSSPSPAASEPAAAPAATPQPLTTPVSPSPLSRMMRGSAPGGATDPAQRDLLASLPPPPISEPLTGDTESSAMRRRRRNRRLLAAAAVIIVVAIGAWLWSGREPSTEIPVVAAETTPEKVKPAEEEGLQVANQNIQVLDPTQSSQAETVMPEPEQPVTPPAPSAEQAPTVVENNASDSSPAPAEQAPAVDAPPAPETPLTAAPLPEPENATTDATPPAPAVPAPQPTQAAEAPAASEPAPAQAAAEPTSAPEPAPAPAPAPATTQPEPAQAAQPEPTATQEAAVTPTAPTGNIRVQLAAGKSEASVQKEWAAMQKAHPDLLGSLSLTIEKVDKGAAGIFYRLQAGPLADKTAAKKLCASLKQQNQDCIVVTK
jgi:hypothetical protein